MKKLILLALLGASAVYAASYTCQIDNMAMYPTGQTRMTPMGAVREYRCPAGHSAWVK